MKTKNIESASNPIFKVLQTLDKSRGINKEGQCLISGTKIIEEVLRLERVELDDSYWVFHSEEHDLFKLTNAPESLVQLSKPLFKELDVLGTHSPLLCVNIPEIKKWNPDDEAQGIELLCALGDPNNLGALIRSAKAFGVNKLVLLEEACHPFHPKVVKSSSGSCFNLTLAKGPSIKSLTSVKNLFALDGQGTPLHKIKFPENARFLLGEEGQGLPNDLESQKVSIPISDEVESLNATVAASIFLYALSSATKK